MMNLDTIEPIAADAILGTYTGKLTKGENWRWAVSGAMRRAAWRYARFAMLPMVVMVLVEIINNRRGPQPPLRHLLGPFIVVNLFAVIWILWIAAATLYRVAKYDPDSRGDTIVRFHPAKVEVILPDGLVFQLPYETLRFTPTRLGLTCETKRRIPLFMLPYRVITPTEIDRILETIQPVAA